MMRTRTRARSTFAARAVVLALAIVGVALPASQARASPTLPHETQHWPQARLLVWARPGVSGLFHLPGNWLEDGGPASNGPDADTDVLLPATRRPYVVRPEIDGEGSEVACRHVTIERNAGFAIGSLARKVITIHGNAWVKRGGRLHHAPAYDRTGLWW